MLVYLFPNMGYLAVPLVPTIICWFVDADRRRQYPEVEKFYPTLDEADFVNDANFKQM